MLNYDFIFKFQMPKDKILRKRATWCSEELQAAINAVKNGKGKRQSAREFGKH